MNFISVLLLIIYKYGIVSFAMWSLFYGVSKLFTHKQSLENSRKIADKFIVIAGIVYAAVGLLTYIVYDFLGPSPPPFKWGIFAQFFIWSVCTQLYWLGIFQRSSILRIIVSLVMLISIHQYIVMMTSLLGEYQIMTLKDCLYPSMTKFILILKGIVFGVIVHGLGNRNEKGGIDSRSILDETLEDL